MGITLAFTLDLRSDYHVSAGFGAGALVDSALQRDVDGVPVLRGTTITGLLRDGLYRLLQLDALKPRYALCRASGRTDEAAPDFCGQTEAVDVAAACPLCRIFGSPRIPKRWRISSARPPGELAAPVQRPPVIGAAQAGAVVAPHVRVNPRTRRAEARKLFFREEGDQELTFAFTVECDSDDPTVQDEAAWLVAAARAVRNLGAARRRGRGECRISLQTPAEQQRFLDYFEQNQLQGRPAPQPTPRPSYTPREKTDAGPVRRVVIARLDEPLIISRRAVAGNEFESANHIPGSVLRGALAARVAARYDLSGADPATYAIFARLFHRGRVQFPTLYPAVVPQHGGRRVHPTIVAPLDLLTCELFPGFPDTAGQSSSLRHGAESYAHQPDALHPQCEHAGCQADRVPFEGYLPLPASSMEAFQRGHTPDHVTEMHVRIDPLSGRAAEGDLFDYDALAPGQYFIGELWSATAADWHDLCALAGLPEDKGEMTLRLGKANRRGYGCVRLLWQPPRVDEAKNPVHPWYVVDIAQRVTALDRLTLTLLTDTIILDEWGRFQTGFDDRWLSQALRVPVQVVRGFCASQMTDSFNGYLGLPRFRDVALRAGSAVGLRVLDTVGVETALNTLRAVEERGIGLRRNEGFGRVVFNHPVYDQGGRGEVSYAWEVGPLQIRAASTAPFYTEAQFRADWDDKLTDAWEKRMVAEVGDQAGARHLKPSEVFREAEFETVARLLRTERWVRAEGGDAETRLALVFARLDRLGEATELLPADLVQRELQVREEDKAKLTFFKNKGRAGLLVLKTLLAALDKEVAAASAPQPESLWRIGLEMLADRIAAEARRDEEDV